MNSSSAEPGIPVIARPDARVKRVPGSRALSLLAPFGLMLSLIGVTGAVLSGIGTRWGWWHFTTGFEILRWAAYAGPAAAVMSIAGGIARRRALRRHAFILPICGIIIGLTVSGIAWSWQQKTRELPRIHDITTDTDNPPAFKALRLIRKGAANKREYRGGRTASLQRSAYPDIKPLIVMSPSVSVFERALAAARRMDWMIVDANPQEGRIEATATTFWFGFKDDVVVRIRSVRGGSRLDLRSVSRTGAGDAGTNAARIRSFLEEFVRTDAPPVSVSESD